MKFFLEFELFKRVVFELGFWGFDERGNMGFWGNGVFGGKGRACQKTAHLVHLGLFVQGFGQF